MRVPAAAEVASTRRSGNDVYVTVNVPQTNIDASKPASITRIEVYGATSLTPPPRTRFLEIAELVATVPVAKAPDPTDTSGTVIPDPTTGALQGTQVTVRDPLSSTDLQPRAIVEPERERRVSVPAAQVGAAVIPAPQVLRRFYMTVPFSDRGRAGPPSTIVALPITPLPESVEALRAAVRPTGVVVEWEPSGGLLGWVLDRSLPVERPPLDEPATAATTAALPSADLPPGPTTYNVYVDISPDPLVLPARANGEIPWTVPVPAPANKVPLATLSYTEPLVTDGRERCYSVRAVRGAIESEPSPRDCVIAYDTEPPAPITGLQVNVLENGIQLLWDPNGEQDLAGYIVLRRDAADATLVQLTDRPITETRYTDRGVRPGVRYTYVVEAADNRLPLPNVSDPVEISETAR